MPFQDWSRPAAVTNWQPRRSNVSLGPGSRVRRAAGALAKYVVRLEVLTLAAQIADI
jgi:hypothetical protein